MKLCCKISQQPNSAQILSRMSDGNKLRRGGVEQWTKVTEISAGRIWSPWDDLSFLSTVLLSQRSREGTNISGLIDGYIELSLEPQALCLACAEKGGLLARAGCFLTSSS